MFRVSSLFVECLPSLAAGLLWNTSYTGDILSYRCNDIDSQFRYGNMQLCHKVINGFIFYASLRQVIITFTMSSSILV